MDYDSELLFPVNKTGRDSNMRNLIRQGRIVERLVDETGVFCRVQWLDKQNLISRPLPVKQSGSTGTSSFYCPKIGDNVSVTMLPNSDGGDGFIDGSFYTTSNPPPITDPDTRHITFGDGTIIEYAEATNARIGGQLRIQSAQPINIVCGICTITAPIINLTGEVNIVGNVEIEGNIKHDGNMDTSGIHTDSNGKHC